MLTRDIIDMFAHIRTNSVAKNRRHSLTATCFEDLDLKGRVTTACEEKEIILLQFMSLNKILPS
jgi:hypothetical protein